MLRDHLRSFWRGVVNDKLTTCINVGGLALGLAVFFALTFYVQREFSWDAHWEDAERIYTLAWSQESQSGSATPPMISGPVPYVLGTHLLGRDPDAFEAYVRMFHLTGTLVVDGQDYSDRLLHYVEPTLLDMLQMETLQGSLQDVFADPRAIAISATAAETLFGTQSPLGRTVVFEAQWGGRADYTIKAVYRVPEPSTLSNIDLMTLLDPAVPPLSNSDLDAWDSRPPGALGSHYFKLRRGESAGRLEADLRAFMDENRHLDFGAGGKVRFSMVPLRDVHLMPSLFETSNNVERLRILAAIGALVLLISGCNFVMLATLRSIDRMREIGIRKTLGGEARQLMRQYLVDVLLQTLAAALLAIALLELILPWLRATVELPLELTLLSWPRLGACLIVVAAFTLLSGLYPALLMLRGQPATLLRNSMGAVVSSGSSLRGLLVGIQFAIVIGLLLASAVVWQQIEYTHTRDRGYDLDQVVGLRINFVDENIRTLTATMVNEFKRVPGVAGAASGGIALSPGIIVVAAPVNVAATTVDGAVTEAALQSLGVSADYFAVMSVPILAGREFSENLDGTAAPNEAGEGGREIANAILNLAATRALGFTTPEAAVGNLVTAQLGGEGQVRGMDLRVIGVVADTQFASSLLPPVAQFYRLSTGNGFIALKLHPEADRAAVMEELRRVWRDVMGEVPFQPLSADIMEGNMLQREEFEARIVTGSAVLALVIALSGLYGLVQATVARRVKEIGVRKVMGAGVPAIVSLLLWQFSKPIVVANLVAWPLGFWGISHWLQRFPYRLDTGVIVSSAVAASLVALLIAWLTIGVMAARAANAKPVAALRYE